MNMIYIGILDTSGICPSDSRVISKIPEEVRMRVEKTGHDGEKALRAGAYMLLSEMDNCLFGGKSHQIVYTGSGKPVFEERLNDNETLHNVPKFSISHDGDISAIIMCDDGFDVGIDVQTEKNNMNYEAISKRFFEKCKVLRDGSELFVKKLTEDPFLLKKNVFIKCFNIIEGCIFEAPYNEFFSETGNVSQKEKMFLKKWTYLEAHLKMSGDGLAGISSFDKISVGSDSGCLEFLKKGRLYSLSACVKQKN